MKKIKRISCLLLTVVMCLGFLSHLTNMPVVASATEDVSKNIAVDINGKDNRPYLKSAVFTDWTINNTIDKLEKVSTTIDGVTFSLSDASGKSIVNGIQNKQLFNSEGTSPLLTLDGATIETFSGGILKFEIDGLPAGTHTLTTWHNFFDAGNAEKQSSMTMTINGEVVAENICGTYKVKDDIDASVVYTSFEAKEGETVTILISSDNNKYYKKVILNAFEIDGVHPKKSIYNQTPENGEGHFLPEVGFTWVGAEGAISHDLYLGTDYEAVKNATRDSEEFVGNLTECKYDTSEMDLSHMETYYWRVDEVFEDGTSKGKVFEFEVAHLAFPTAEGYGRYAKGGRGGRIIEVTTLEDGYEMVKTDMVLDDEGNPVLDENGEPTYLTEKRPIAGSLRYALEYEKGARIVVFKVGGIIALQSALIIPNDGGNVYVAGQTAPGDGITLINYDFGALGAEDVIIRNVRVRVGDSNQWSTGGMGLGSCNNSIVDHCSISWSTDEGFSSRKAYNITVQWTIIAESLNNSVHFAGSESGKVEDRVEGETSRHGFAASISGKIGSFHHNLLAHNAGRNFSLAGGLESDGVTLEGYLDLRNNVVYNWQHRTNDGGLNSVQLVNNYYKFGPASKRLHILRIDDNLTDQDNTMVYAEGNIMTNLDGSYDLAPTDDGFEVGKVILNEISLRSEEELWESYVNTETAEECYESVLANAGATYPKRDYLDSRYVEETKNTTYTYKGSKDGYLGIIDSQEDVGGYPTEEQFKGGEAPLDTDHDGMPDEWESLHGLNPEDYNDASQIYLSDEGYTNIELYLNELMGDPVVYSDNPTLQWPEVTATPEPTEPAETATPEPTEILYTLGDVNADGNINAQDALAVLKHAAKISVLDEVQCKAADVVKDENINAQDALQILKKAAHIIDSF